MAQMKNFIVKRQKKQNTNHIVLSLGPQTPNTKKWGNFCITMFF